MPDDNEDDDQIVTLSRKDIRALERKAQKYDEANQRATAAERDLAFAKAGIDLSDPRQAYFRKGYDSDDLTPEAIKAAAIEAGFLENPAEKQQQDTSGDAAALARMADAEANGGLPPAGVDAAVDRVLQADSPEAFWAAAESSGLTTN